MPDSNLTVFILDDDPGFLKAAVRLVKTRGYNVHGAANIPGILNRLPFPRNSCILSDIVLVGDRGLDLPDLLAQRGVHVPIVFLSVSGDPELLARADELGYAPTMRKPVEADDLFAVLRLLDNRGSGPGAATTKPTTGEKNA